MVVKNEEWSWEELSFVENLAPNATDNDVEIISFVSFDSWDTEPNVRLVSLSRLY